MSWVGQTADQVSAGALRPRSDQDADPVGIDGDSAEREAEAACTRLVQPLQVIDDDRDRLGLAELRQQSPESNRHGESIDVPRGFDTAQSNR
jgi:hypothetical protein